jgi:hypothetical protein
MIAMGYGATVDKINDFCPMLFDKNGSKLEGFFIKPPH